MSESRQEVTLRKIRNGLRKQREKVLESHQHLMDILSEDVKDPILDNWFKDFDRFISLSQGGMKKGEVTLFVSNGRHCGKSTIANYYDYEVTERQKK